MQLDQTQYELITRVFPRPCADILMFSPTGKVWLMYRANQPFIHQWWFPGGRVHFNETRRQTATRKLNEECQLSDQVSLQEIGTQDLFFAADGRDYHDITTLFKTEISEFSVIKTDSQAVEHGWFTLKQCENLNLHPYILKNIEKTLKNMH